jgi:hypothetical protein
METTRDPLGSMLSFDALNAVEVITGKDYKADDDTTWLGIALMHEDSRNKEAALLARGDTTFMNDTSRYLTVIEGAGFERCLEQTFVGGEGEERFFIYARRDGLLLSFDTFGAKHINGAKVYYNWRPSDGVERHRLTSSGGFAADRKTWIGDHDAREALLYKMDRLAAFGELVCPWIERPFLWLLHYMDTKSPGYNHRAINEARIALLPQWVRDMITPPAESGTDSR